MRIILILAIVMVPSFGASSSNLITSPKITTSRAERGHKVVGGESTSYAKDSLLPSWAKNNEVAATKVIAGSTKEMRTEIKRMMYPQNKQYTGVINEEKMLNQPFIK